MRGRAGAGGWSSGLAALALLLSSWPVALAGVEGSTVAAGSADGVDLVRAGLVTFGNEARP